MARRTPSPNEVAAWKANYQDAREALALICEVVEELAPPGSVPNTEYLTPELSVEAEALVRGIRAIADVRARRGPRAPQITPR